MILFIGAKYESCSPNGQRCFLAAQNPTIRDILHQKDQKINTKRKKKVKAKGKCPSSGLRYGDFLQRYHTPSLTNINTFTSHFLFRLVFCTHARAHKM